MNEELVKEILIKGEGLLTKLAETAGKTAGHVYEVLVRQQMIQGGYILLGIIVWMIGSVLIAIKLSKILDENEEGFAQMVFFLGAWSILYYAIFSSLYNGLGRLINPEYYAIEFILESLK